jgi:hypothetical protein
MLIFPYRTSRVSDVPECWEKAVMKNRRAVSAKIKILMVAAMLYPACLFAAAAQTSGGAASGSMGAHSTSGIGAGQTNIPPPGTNSLGTANSSGMPGGATVGANMGPKDSQAIDAEINGENSKVDSKINSICRGC